MWIYKTCKVDGYLEEKKLEELLNEYGKEGWELVNIIPQISSSSDSSWGDVDINIECCEMVYVDYNMIILKKKMD